MGGKDTKGTSQVGTGKPSWDLPSGTNVNFNKDNFANVLGSDIASIYGQGPKPLDTYAGFSGTTKGALEQYLQQAKDWKGYADGATGYAQNLIDRGGLTSGQAGNLATVNQIGNKYGALANSADDPSLTERTLMGVAQGKYLNGANPYFERNLAEASDAARTAVNTSIGGRYGSNIHTQDIVNNVGNLENSARGAQYETERDRQLQALNAIEGQRQQGFGNTLAALGAQSGNAGTAFGMGQQGVSNAMNAGNQLSSLYQASQMPYEDMLKVGQIRDANLQADLNSTNNIRNGDFQHLQNYLGLLGGTQDNKEKSNPFLDILGVGGTLASLFL